MANLRVFDLQRFALHDGPGIRTTVFLKGCPLDCVWCHNPESKRYSRQLGYLEKTCIRCGRCEEICPQKVHHISEDGVHTVNFSACLQCGKCVDACPGRALKIFGKDLPHEEILKIILRDRDFYQRSGGGMTVSGGEPMMQFEGLWELLRAAKQEGIHVCLDTSGQADPEKYRQIADLVDIFLFDYKITDAKLHRQYIGTDSRRILDNLDLLCGLKKDIFLRCPIIPGINDTEEHYRAIAKLSGKYDAIRQVNVMAYHDMAKGKAEQIGMPYILAEKKTVERDEKRQIYEKLKEYGCLHLQES